MSVNYNTKYNPHTKKLQWVVDTTSINGLTFRPGVANEAALPSSGNATNDARITNDNHHLYVWNGSAWVDQGDIFDIDWSAIANKPSSSVANIDDAVSKKHTQNTDTKLDEGEANEVTAAQLKSLVDDAIVDGDFSSNGLMKRTAEGVYASVTAPTGDIVGTSDSQTLTNKELSDQIETLEMTAGENVSPGDVCYLKSDGKMWKTDANAEATSKGLVLMAIDTITADNTGTFLVKGKYTTSGLTAADVMYLSATAGAITNTAPSGSGDIVRIIGYALSTTVLYFNPDKSYLEIS